VRRKARVKDVVEGLTNLDVYFLGGMTNIALIRLELGAASWWDAAWLALSYCQVYGFERLALHVCERRATKEASHG
jgi:hypothetical protein